MPLFGNLIIIKRYLRATKWASAKVAIERLEGTLKWRREYGIYDELTAELVEPEVSGGAVYFFIFLLRFYGFDSPFRFCSPLSFHHGMTRRLHAFFCVCVWIHRLSRERWSLLVMIRSAGPLCT